MPTTEKIYRPLRILSNTCVRPPWKLIWGAAYLATCSPIIVSPGLEKKLGTILHKNSQTDSQNSQVTSFTGSTHICILISVHICAHTHTHTYLIINRNTDRLWLHCLESIKTWHGHVRAVYMHNYHIYTSVTHTCMATVTLLTSCRGPLRGRWLQQGIHHLSMAAAPLLQCAGQTFEGCPQRA